MYYIGIDTGTNTGFAIWDNRQEKFLAVSCLKIHVAMREVERIVNQAAREGTRVCVRVEDARLRDWFGGRMTREEERAKLQGVGSVKRDCSIWEDFLTDLGVDFQMVHPKNIATKMKAEAFKYLTKWDERTNEHGRDAAMLVFGL